MDALLPRPFRPTAGKLGTRRTRGRVRWQPLLYVPAAVAFARLRRRLGPPPAPVTVAVVYAAPAVVAYALPRGRVRYALGWLCHMWAYKVAFEVPYDHRDRQRSRLRITTPVAIDRLIGFGVPPSQRLQRRLRRPPQLTVLDRVLTGFYLLWEVEPHAALAWLLWRHPDRLPAAMLRMALTFDCTLVGYFATPTAPPWWASEVEGHMDGQVRRVVVEVIRALKGDARPGSPEDHQSGANPWAAWPSDHFASTLSAALALREADARAGALGFAYAAVLGFTLVYAGEHYVVDLLLGALVALTIHGAESPLAEEGMRQLVTTAKPQPRARRLIRWLR